MAQLPLLRRCPHLIKDPLNTAVSIRVSCLQPDDGSLRSHEVELCGRCAQHGLQILLDKIRMAEAGQWMTKLAPLPVKRKETAGTVGDI